MSTSSRTINISHLGRVEGHGGIFIKLANGHVSEVNLDVHEGSRYYEALLKGKHFLEVQGIITRVCAICSANHTVAALTALEDALDIPQSDRIFTLRGLLLHGATIESHALHIFALALPDFFGCDSVIALAAKRPAEVKYALKLKQLGNRIQELVGGRAVHPINTLVGGFGKLPSHRDLEKLKAELEQALPPLMLFVDFASTIEIPDFAEQPTLYLALRPYDEGYRYRGVSICTSQNEEHPLTSYREVVREFVVEHSHAKHSAMSSGESYMVGSLARIRLWGDRLSGRAEEAYQTLFPNGFVDNILLNTWAQLVELVHSIERAIAHCDTLLAMPEEQSEMTEYETKAGRGIGAIEVPRGTLFHEYEIDEKGYVTSANVITPTAQNLANVEKDMRGSVEALLRNGEPDDEELRQSLAMVARAYDPCISCSVHVTRIDE